MAGRIHFDHIDKTTLGNRGTWFAFATRIDGWSALPVFADAIQRLGNQTRSCRFSYPANTGHQKGMRQAIALDRIAQRLHHCVLTDQFIEGRRPVFPRQNTIRLRRTGSGLLRRFHTACCKNIG